MRKLLAANFLRLKREKAFLAGLLFMLAVGILYPLLISYNNAKGAYQNHIDDGFFSSAVLIGIVLAVFVGLFVGTEYSDGAIRNKILVGHSRRAVYLANLVTCMAGGFALCAAFYLPMLGLGLPLLGGFEMDLRRALLTTAAIFFLSAAYASVFTLIAMLSQNKAVTAVLCILTAVIFLVVGFQIYNRLSEPEVYPNYVYEVGGAVGESVEMENPRYLKGAKRQVYEFFFDFLPGGQSIQCFSRETAHPLRLSLYSAVVTALTTAAGIALFERKDLR